ncbi:MAG TPA: glycosyltransferase [Vicinamibacteria bacterium]|nr:glycosyltransferase [Vicinamibacteria bacterium]
MKILIVSWAWPPIGRVGALRPVGMAREWGRLGHEVHVLTGPGDRGGEYAPDLAPAGEASGAAVHRAPAPGIPLPAVLRAAHELRPEERVATSIPRWRQIVSQWKRFPDPQRSWIRPAIALGRALDAQHRFDVVWSTSPPESVHFVGRALAAAGLPWVADFRDPWSQYALARWDPLSRWTIDRLTKRVLRGASAVTANADGIARFLSAATGREVTCVRNGYDVAFDGPSRAEPRSLGYFGRIDPLRQDASRLWPALRERQAAGRPWRVDFFSAPGGGGGAVVEVPADLRAQVRVLPPVPHAEALARMPGFAALLVLGMGSPGGEGTVAGKLYEYVGSGRPVLVCAPPTSEARSLTRVTSTGLGGWTSGELSEALAALETFVVDPAGRASLSRAAAATKMLALFGAVPRLPVG